jgi:hypothetical protein
MPKTTICPVCKDPVGNDPHEDCFQSVQGAKSRDAEADMLAMPCPACGGEMVNMSCRNSDCEMGQPEG